jgi:nucleotide-binding universal stress UspA family protein
MTTFHNILCPVDFSPTSRRALTVACELAASSHAALVIAHVWQIALYGGVEFGTAGEVLQAVSDADEARLVAWRDEARGQGVPEAASLTLTGTAWDEIVKLAARAPAVDLIVMGTHGRGMLAHALLGSVAERVVRHAPCAVLVIR